jgi:hypothetical protein
MVSRVQFEGIAVKNLKLTAVVVCGLQLGGCMTAQERVAADDRQCQSYGVAPGSPGYVECRMRLDQQHANARLVNSTSPVGLVVNAASGQ